MESKNYGTVICNECGTRVSIDDAEASYNDELDDVIFYCTKCIYDPAYLPAVSNDGDEAVEQLRAVDGGESSAKDTLTEKEFQALARWWG